MLKRIACFFCGRWYETGTTHSIKQVLSEKYNFLSVESDPAFKYDNYPPLWSKTVKGIAFTKGL